MFSKKDHRVQIPEDNLSVAEHHPDCGLRALNDQQHQAVRLALRKPFILIQGPPGNEINNLKVTRFGCTCWSGVNHVLLTVLPACHLSTPIRYDKPATKNLLIYGGAKLLLEATESVNISPTDMLRTGAVTVLLLDSV